MRAKMMGYSDMKILMICSVGDIPDKSQPYHENIWFSYLSHSSTRKRYAMKLVKVDLLQSKMAEDITYISII